jgi:predicted ATPase/transcriptional regulator with XRE-family HTH domain/predicted negative regulator of RcsB-dependent stress response
VVTGSVPRSFNDLLRRHRLDAGLTQEALAERAGLSVRGLSDLERGVNRAPYVATVVRLGDALNLSDAQRVELENAISRHRKPANQHTVVHLPEQLTSLVGRDLDVDRVARVFRWEGRRLVTLIGPGGVGKTRLSIKVASTIASDFEGGTFFVPLEEVIDAAGVGTAIATALQIRDDGTRSVADTLVEHLMDREILLVLDGYEHLMEGAFLPGFLLVRCPRLKILVTSRAPLHVRGEHEFPVDTLAVPPPESPVDLDTLGLNPAVALFVARSRAVRPDFALTLESARVVAEICRRLDGLPLAIELAAARIKTLSPDALLLRLERRLSILIGGPRDTPLRQQTMRNTIAWSYDLLPAAAQVLFRHVSLFNASFGIDEAMAVLGPPLSVDAEETLPILVDSSLLSVTPVERGAPRYAMLETIREFGLERLADDDESDAAWKRLTAYVVDLVETAEGELHGERQAAWMTRLEDAHPMLLLTLHRARTSDQMGIGLQIAAALWRFWYSRGYLSEGRRQLTDLLAAADDADRLSPAVAAKAYRGAAVLAAVQGDYAESNALSQEGLTRYRALGDQRGEAAMYVVQGSTAYYTGDYETARARYAESLVLFRQTADEPSMSVALNNLANIAKQEGRTDESVTLYEESLAIKRRLGDTRGIAIALNNLGTVALTQGDFQRAATAGEEALTLLRDLGDKDFTAAVDTVARAALHRGDIQRAADLYREGLAVSGAAGDRELIAFCLEGMGHVAAAGNNGRRAITLYAASDSLRRLVGAPLPPAEHAQQSALVDEARVSLGEGPFSHAWDNGQRLDLDAAVRFAEGTDGEVGDSAFPPHRQSS